MLALTRKPDEAVRIGEDIEVRIVFIKGNNVRLAITAPRHLKIKRCEYRPRPRKAPGGKP